MSCKLIKHLSGHSGCQISLFADNGAFFIRKTAGSQSYNTRLRSQVAKQISFNNNANKILTPQIYRTGTNDGVFFVDMQYVNCHTMAQHMKSVTIKEISSLIDMLVDELHIQDSSRLLGANDVFQNKIQTLYKSIVPSPLYKAALDRLSAFDFSDVPYSKCHGDLTLENILIDVNNFIYLIDFLDSFFDSYMVDIAKLLQDLELHWSYRYEEKSPNLKLRLLVAKEALLESISKLPDGQNKIIQIYYILLLNVMRIVPYAKDKTTIEWLTQSISKIMTILDSKENRK